MPDKLRQSTTTVSRDEVLEQSGAYTLTPDSSQADIEAAVWLFHTLSRQAGDEKRQRRRRVALSIILSKIGVQNPAALIASVRDSERTQEETERPDDEVPAPPPRRRGAGETPVDDVLLNCGLDTLGDDPPDEAVQVALLELRKIWVRADPVQREILLNGAIRRLKKARYPRPADTVARILGNSASEETDKGPVGTIGPNVVDLVLDGGKGVLLTTEGYQPCAWPIPACPWSPIPTRAAVEAALQAGGRPPWEDLTHLLASRAVLPGPQDSWASLLAAWVFGTYLVSRFAYWPLLLLEGPPERGKTRLGKAIIFSSFRGSFTPSPTPAVLFRDRAYHRVTLLLDVEDLPKALERSDLGDLVLNSFERDGTVRRTTRPDAAPQQQVEEFRTYGPTVLVSNRRISERGALRSRCIRVPMPEAGSTPVPDAVTPDDVVELRARLVAWASGVADIRLPEVDPPFTGRMRDLAKPVLQVLALVEPAAVDEVVDLLRAMDRDRRQEASRTWEARVAVALWEARSKVEAGRLYIEHILPFVNDGLPETEKLSAQQIGTARRNLGLMGARGGAGGRTFVMWPGDDEAKRLHERYSPEGPEMPSASSGSSDIPGNPGFSPLKTLKTLKTPSEAFSPENPRKTYMSEDPEHSEQSEGGFSEIMDDLFEGAKK